MIETRSVSAAEFWQWRCRPEFVRFGKYTGACGRVLIVCHEPFDETAVNAAAIDEICDALRLAEYEPTVFGRIIAFARGLSRWWEKVGWR